VARPSRCRRNFFVFTAVASLIFGAAPRSTDASAQTTAPPVSRLTWTPCFTGDGDFECATLFVPLDYDEPGDNPIPIAVIRQPATNPGRRIGSLVVNPGGPGGSGVDFVRDVGPALFTDEVRARFDIVGFDPRGIMRSRPLRCFDDPSQWTPLFQPVAFPSTPEEEQAWITADRYLLTSCDLRAGPIIDHMATADVARDLERLRHALGDDKLSYVGYSYGSYLGVTYANLFPDHFRALVVDGVVDPIQWATGSGDGTTVPYSSRLRGDAGAQATLGEFFRLCDAAGSAGCALAPDAAGRFAALADRLRIAPITIINPLTQQPVAFNYSLLIANTLGALYSSRVWPVFAELLTDLEISAAAPAGAALTALHHLLAVDDATLSRYQNQIEGAPGVACSDTDNPHDYAAWSAAGVAADAAFGYFGRMWTWVSSQCAEWRGQDADRFVGPFTTRTAAPVLVVGNVFDPATRYEGAVTVDQLLPRSRLVTVHGWGHTSLGLSSCADTAVGRYLLFGSMPAVGTVCEQDFGPFDLPATAAEVISGSSPGRIVHILNLPPGAFP
jgi:pimeloyl-ACP methyl ester carboxylesterase